MKDSPFRLWLMNIWMEHKEEMFLYEHTAVNYDVREYFQRHKWWLKREYKRRCKR